MNLRDIVRGGGAGGAYSSRGGGGGGGGLLLHTPRDEAPELELQDVIDPQELQKMLQGQV